MFYTIHRTIKGLIFCAMVCVGLSIYNRREVFEPAAIWYDVWDNGGFHVEAPKRMAGRVEYVAGSQVFVLRTRPFRQYNVRLMGLRPPSEERSVEAMAKEEGRRKALADLIEGKWVHLEYSYENMNNLGGVVFLGQTNVNAELVRWGVARANKETAKGLPKESQYALIWAARHRLTWK